jgi:hypothetical protein
MDGRRFVGVLQEVEKCLIRVCGLPDNLVWQDEFTEILAVVGICRGGELCCSDGRVDRIGLGCSGVCGDAVDM